MTQTGRAFIAMPDPFDRQVDLLAIAHRIDERENFPTGDNPYPPHRLELEVAVRQAVETASSRTLSRIWGFGKGQHGNRELAEELGVAPRTVQRWRSGERSLTRSRYREAVLEASVRRYVRQASSATALRRIARIISSGAAVTFQGDYSIFNWTDPAVRQLRRNRRIQADFTPARAGFSSIGPVAGAALRNFAGLARAGDWEDAADELEDAFWRAYFADNADADELEPEWIHPTRLTITEA